MAKSKKESVFLSNIVSQDVIAAKPSGIMLRILQVDALKEDDLFVHILLGEVGREHSK